METILQAKRIHMIGVKGAGMAALAEILVSRGIVVTGSDTDEVFFTDATLRRIGILPMTGFSPANIPLQSSGIIYSTAYRPETNTEVAAALARSDIPVVSYPQAVGALTEKQPTILVAGTHGKTTTSALLAETFRALGEDPQALVGSRIPVWGGNALVGKGKYFILEADEYQNKLRFYQPWGAILTSVDWDHPDFFPTTEEYEAVFRSFVEQIPPYGFLISWGDSALVERIASSSRAKRRTYGFLEGNDFRIVEYKPLSDGPFRQSFRILQKVEGGEKDLGTFHLRLAGRHNAQNATAVVAAVVLAGGDLEQARSGMERFYGTERRFERIGTFQGAIIYDDYAHHPEELKVTLTAFRELFPERRIVAIFHPHTFTRTKALLADFVQSFDKADRVLILDIYGSAREEAGGVSSADLVFGINRYHRDRAEHIPTLEEAIAYLREKTLPNDLIVTFGAGDVWRIGRALVEKEDREG